MGRRTHAQRLKKPGNAPYRGPVVENYFDNLLPDSDGIRRRIAKRFRMEGCEPYQLLAAIDRILSMVK
ncbi:hypothetical protein RugamoR57_34220 [Duganella caerulea]|uniref:HipA N-terminal domain-containing protein n=1 Tax=Duganella caerulea TaxID=2885762 RepID=UPI0030EB0503